MFWEKAYQKLDLDEDHVLVMQLNDNGRITSIVINRDENVMPSYFVMNLNIIQHDGIESYFITKYIPADGKPFYSYSGFIGKVEFYDFDGNLLNTSTRVGRHETFILGCYAYVIQYNTGLWNIQSAECICAACGSSGGGSTSSGSEGDTGTGGYGNNGYGNGGNNGGSGGDGSGNNTPGIPNIPSENVQDQKKYTSFLGRLNNEQTQFLYEQPGYNISIFNYLKLNNFKEIDINLMKVVINHLIANTDNYGVHILWKEVSRMFNFAKKLLQDNPDTINKEQIFVRIKALDVLLKQNPDALLDIECQELPNWKTVDEQPIPVSVKNKLYQLKTQGLFTSVQIQNIVNANAPRVNMDLFPVKINNMPIKPNGQKYTQAEFFDYFRKNINTIIQKPELSQFHPAVYPNYGKRYGFMEFK